VVNVRYQHAGYDEALAEADPEPGPGAAAAKAAPFVRAGEKVGATTRARAGRGRSTSNAMAGSAEARLSDGHPPARDRCAAG